MNPWTTISADELTPKHAGKIVRLRPIADDPEVVIQARLRTVTGPLRDGRINITVDGVPCRQSFNDGWDVQPDSLIEVRR